MTFEEAQVGSINITPGLEAVIAPAMLPRNSLNHSLLLAIQEAQLRVPLRSTRGTESPRVTGASYLLSYLDEDMLIGRAVATGGSFVFTRDVEGNA